MYGTGRKLGLRVCVGAAGAVLVLSGVAAIRADKLPAELQPDAVKIDPDAGLVATPYDGPVPFDLPEDELRDGLRTDECFTLAYPDVQFEDQTRKWRGNLINVDRERKLNKLRAWLKITDGVDAEVYFFVYKRDPADASYDELYQAPITLHGDGTWKYYNSGPITAAGGGDLILEAGITKIHLIGIAWGTTAISYARETRSGAYSYGEGMVFGSSGANNITPPLPSSFFITQADNVYIIDPCFDPLPGACCRPNNTCVNVENQTACDQLGGQFAAPGVLCGIDVTECPMPKGRCCTPPEACVYLNYWKCFSDAIGGVSWTEGENCELPNECFEPEGACCLFDGSCANLTDTECSALDGGYAGDFSFCESTICNATGACCTPQQGCLQLEQADCNATVGAVYMEDGSHCQDVPAGFPVDPCDDTIGACCYYDGFCEEVTRFECEVDVTGTYTPGVWQGAGVSCAAAQCQPQAACCTGTTSCSNMDIDDFDVCTNGNPEWGWYPGRPCEYDPCSDLGQVGACCVLGECAISNKIDCETSEANGGLGGVYIDAGSNGWQACKEGFANCQAENGNMGACCVGENDCQITTQGDCTGFYHGDGVPCSQYLCSVGVCCLGDECQQKYPIECEDDLGDRGPLGMACGDNTCVEGACCAGSDGNQCSVVREFECELPTIEGGLGGEYQGPATDCTPNPCFEGPGACCVDDSCAVLDEETCLGFSGDYQGEGTDCVENACDFGACCDELGNCRETTRAICVYEELSTNAFQGDGTTCDPNPCPQPTAPCCFDNESCLDLTPADCQSQGGYTNFDTTQTCASNGFELCTEGACCSGPFCNQRGALRCLDEGHVPIGAGTSCTPSPCLEGACCDYAGGCQDGLLEIHCDDVPGGTFLVGDVCTSGLCDPYNLCLDLPLHDFDTNGTVDLRDYYFLQQCFGQSSPIECLCAFDDNRDETVDLDDVPGFLSDLDLGGPPTDPVGACCDTNAFACSNGVFEVHCQGPDEVWTEGTACNDLDPPCLPTGACCDLLGVCSNGLYQADCDQIVGGVFSAGQDCGAIVCDSCTNSVPGNRPSDFDGDVDTDLADFFAFQECFGASPTTECLCIFDANLDGVIDPDDLAQFVSDLDSSGPT